MDTSTTPIQDIERRLIGWLMTNSDPNAIRHIYASSRLMPHCFATKLNQTLYKIITELSDSGAPPTIELVKFEYSKANQSISNESLDRLMLTYTETFVLPSAIDSYAKLIVEAWGHRELDRIASTTAAVTVKDRITDIMGVLNEIIGHTGDESTEHISNILHRSFERMIKPPSEGGIVGVNTGFISLNNITDGWQKGRLIIVAARPGMGKTALALAFARNAGVPTLIVSLEMMSEELTDRLIASEIGIPARNFRYLSSNEALDIGIKLDPLAAIPMYIASPKSNIDINDLRALISHAVLEHGIEMVIIDYLQLMSGGSGSGNREQEISTITRSLKGMAKEFGIPIIALSQLSRAVETRGGDKRPQLSDLRESGAIEQDADVVSFLYRPEYYGITQDADGNSTRGVAEVIIAKHRNGDIGTVKLHFDPPIGKFTDSPTDTIDTPYPDKYEVFAPF